MFGIPVSELAMLAALIIAGALVTGLLAGLFGVGGGGVIVPVLYEIFRVMQVPDDVRMQLCVGTSLAIIIPTSIRSFGAHRRKRDLPVEILRQWALPVTLGVLIGGVIAAFAPASIFKIAFVVIALAIGAKFLFGRDSWKLGDTLPGSFLMNVYGLIIGLYSALMGVGGGSVSNAILVFYGQTIHAAVGIASGIGVLISIVGAISFMVAGWPHQATMPALSVGFVSLIGFALMAPITSFAAPFGARLAHALPKRQLEIAFGVFLWLVALRFIVSVV
ncbi:MAG TPA: sulfite exporter TauE/SafE family protein [Pseudorhodoplanes sp.]|nr:sulfite exporter TauE/SafE family protein [Pseudorhodoplanes sp.]